MARGGGGSVLLLLTVASPPKGILHSLQDKESQPVDARMSTGRSMLFEIPVRLEEGKAGWRFLGDFVRTEGKTRRFVYVATGRQAGQPHTECSRRAKVDLPEPTAAMIKLAQAGELVLVASYPGTDKDGWPTCATVKVEWKVGKR
jgi:hypothetical protein